MKGLGLLLNNPPKNVDILILLAPEEFPKRHELDPPAGITNHELARLRLDPPQFVLAERYQDRNVELVTRRAGIFENIHQLVDNYRKEIKTRASITQDEL